HDRDAAVPDRDVISPADAAQPRTQRLTLPVQRAPQPDALQAALHRLRLQGAVFLRAEYREPWAYKSLPGPETAKILRPDTDRVILFHVVATGACWVAVADGERHWAKRG